LWSARFHGALTEHDAAVRSSDLPFSRSTGTHHAGAGWVCGSRLAEQLGILASGSRLLRVLRMKANCSLRETFPGQAHFDLTPNKSEGLRVHSGASLIRCKPDSDTVAPSPCPNRPRIERLLRRFCWTEPSNNSHSCLLVPSGSCTTNGLPRCSRSITSAERILEG
jgi:hypothetical protein